MITPHFERGEIFKIFVFLLYRVRNYRKGEGQGHYLNAVFFQNNAVPHVQLEIEKYVINIRQIFVNMR